MALDAALGAGLLVETGDTRRPLRFTHALVAHALYSELGARHRRRLHGRAVHVLRRVDETPRPDTVVELARHSALAGDLTAAQTMGDDRGRPRLRAPCPVRSGRVAQRARSLLRRPAAGSRG